MLRYILLKDFSIPYVTYTKFKAEKAKRASWLNYRRKSMSSIGRGL